MRVYVWNCRTVYDSAECGWLIAARWLDRNQKTENEIKNQIRIRGSGFSSVKQPHNTVQQLSGQCLYKCPFMLMNCSLNFDASSIQNVPRCTAMPCAPPILTSLRSFVMQHFVVVERMNYELDAQLLVLRREMAC